MNNEEMNELMQQALNDPELNLPANTDAYLIKPDTNHLASHFYRQLARYIIAFESKLDSNQEVGIKLVSFGESTTMHVDYIGFSDPSLITFYGVSSDRKPMQLIQHLSQLNFLLTSVDKIPQRTERKTIGFRLQEQLKQPSKKGRKK